MLIHLPCQVSLLGCGQQMCLRQIKKDRILGTQTTLSEHGMGEREVPGEWGRRLQATVSGSWRLVVWTQVSHGSSEELLHLGGYNKWFWDQHPKLNKWENVLEKSDSRNTNKHQMERWFCVLGLLLLFQKTPVQSPAPIQWLTASSVQPGHQTLMWCTYICMYI